MRVNEKVLKRDFGVQTMKKEDLFQSLPKSILNWSKISLIAQNNQNHTPEVRTRNQSSDMSSLLSGARKEQSVIKKL